MFVTTFGNDGLQWRRHSGTSRSMIETQTGNGIVQVINRRNAGRRLGTRQEGLRRHSSTAGMAGAIVAVRVCGAHRLRRFVPGCVGLVGKAGVVVVVGVGEDGINVTRKDGKTAHRVIEIQICHRETVHVEARQ